MPGDVVMVSTYGVPELTNLGLKIGPNGEVVLPYLGSVKLAGLTASEAAIFLSTALKNGGLLVDPQISVQLTDSPTRIITVIGEVQRPMPIPAFGQLRLLDVISACGGFTPLASHRITVQRPSNPDPIIVEIGVNAKATDVSDIPLMAGDTVIVPKVGSVFVVGEVKSSLAFPLSSNTPVTVMRAITMAGGVKFSAALSKARVIRTTPDNQRVEIMLDLKKLMNGEQQDIALASDDVLFVPANSFKAALAGGGASVLSALVITGTQTYSVIR
jgi:polysaccharide export outer membrane protein